VTCFLSLRLLCFADPRTISVSDRVFLVSVRPEFLRMSTVSAIAKHSMQVRNTKIYFYSSPLTNFYCTVFYSNMDTMPRLKCKIVNLVHKQWRVLA
jgi:hypothetical protein